MNNWLLILPVVGIVMLVASLWLFHRLVPLEHTVETPEERHASALSQVAGTFASYVVNVIRKERSDVVHAAAVREMRTSARFQHQQAVESDIEHKRRALAG